MFGNLRFITIFDKLLLPSQGDLSAQCFCHFSTINMQQHIDFPMEILVLKFQACQLDEKHAFQK